MRKYDDLYARNSNGKINYWSIRAEDDGRVMIQEGILGGAITRTFRQSKGKNIGKMNETTAYEQACLDAQSRWENKKKKGYKSVQDLGIHTMAEGDINVLIDMALPQNRTDANNLSKPMKAQPYFDDKGRVRISFPCIGQPKLNGFRVIARWEKVIEGEGLLAQEVEKVVFRSKEGLRYTALEHIEQQFTRDMFFLDKVVTNETIEIAYDGEMYSHGMKLQDISSAVKKKNPNTSKLKFHIFDLAIDKMKQKERLETMITMLLGHITALGNSSNIAVVLHGPVNSDEEAQKMTDLWIQQGFEGGIFRDPKAIYQFGSRPKTMVKLKRTEDEDFPIVDVVGGENAPDIAVFVCQAKNGLRFKVNSQGTEAERKEFLANSANYIGKKLQLKFYEYTKDGIPFHIKEVVVRDYE